MNQYFDGNFQFNLSLKQIYCFFLSLICNVLCM